MLFNFQKKISFFRNYYENGILNKHLGKTLFNHKKIFSPHSIIICNYSTNYKQRKFTYEYNFQTIFEILKACNLEPNYHNENTLRTKYCPVCVKPHNEDATNLNTLVIYRTNSIYYCYRCGNRGHFQRLLKILSKKFDLSEYKSLMNHSGYSSNGNTTGTENEDFFPRQYETFDDSLNERKFNKSESNVNEAEMNFNYTNSQNFNFNQNNNHNTISSLNSLNLNNKENYKIFLNNTGLISEMFKRNILLENEKCAIILDYLVNERKLKLETLKFYKIGVSYEKFKSNSLEYINLPSVTYPMFYPTDKSSYVSVDKNSIDETVYNYYKCDKFYLSRLKVRAIGTEFKHFQRIEPSGSVLWGLFGLDTVPDDAQEIIITEGEYDAMAAYQVK